MTMMLASGKLSDAAVITGPIGLGDLGLTNLQKPSVQEPYRFSGTAAVIIVDLGSAQSINLAALIAHTSDANATCRVSAGSTTATTDFILADLPMQSQLEAAGGVSPLAKNIFYQSFAAQTYRYWKFTITAPGSAYMDIGRLYVANAFQPTYNMVFGMNQGMQDLSSEYLTLSSDSLSQIRTKRKVSEFSLEDLTEDESYGSLLPMDYLVGTTKDVLFIPFPDAKKYLQFNSVYGKIAELNPVSWTAFRRFKKQYRVVELPS